jgi:integrase
MQGISERIKGSGIWWIRWTGADGKRHFEKAGTHNAAKSLLNERRQEVILRKKQPELLRSRAVTFNDRCDDALKHSGAENSEKQTYELGLHIDQLRPVFGSRPADSIRKNEVVEWLTEQAEEREWAATTRNRWQATFSPIFRVGLDNEKIERNPAARIRKKTEGGRRVRFLSDPEEKRLRTAIEHRSVEFLPHFLLSIHTGMRMSEQYGLRWSQVDFYRRQLHLIRTKNGDSRTIPLNAIALGALKQLQGGKSQPGTAPSSLPCGRAIPSRGRADGSRPRSKRRRFRSIPGIATAIPLPVDLLWLGWICGRLQNCSGIGRSRWSRGTHISLRNTTRRQLTVWSLPRDGW